MARTKKPGTDPVKKRDPRFDPADDAESARAFAKDPAAAPTTKRPRKPDLKPGDNPAAKHKDARFDPQDDKQSAAAFGEGADDSDDKSDRAEDVQGLVKRMLEEAIAYYEESLEPDQATATDYYHARPFGNEKEGRSQVVSPDVRNATRAQRPSLARIFFGPERQVEYRARGPEDEQGAEQATDYVNYIVNEDNAGYLLFRDWWTDGLVRRLGITKWWWDDTSRVEVSKHSGLLEEQVALLESDPECEVEITAIVPNSQGAQYDVTVTRREKDGRARVQCVPPEEFVFSPGSRALGSAPLVAHVREVPADELYALGIDKDIVDENKGKTRSSKSDALDTARQFDDFSVRFRENQDDRDESQQLVLYAEAYALVDGDGDDIAELRMFQCVGPEYEIVNGDGLGEIVDEVPFAIFTPDPEPHTIVGLSNFDLLKDVQLIKSQVTRGLLDDLAQHIDPSLVVVEGQVNMKDVLGPDASKVIRVRRSPDDLRDFRTSFAGPDIMPILSYFDQAKEDATGTSRAAAGLDADALQSSTKAAVAATLSGSQQQIEELARVFAEMALKPMYKGLLRLICKHQDYARIVRLRGKYVPCDPRQWDATMDVQVNVGLGQGPPEDRINALTAVLNTQKELQSLGAPFVTFAHIRNTCAKLLQAAGERNIDQYMGEWTQEDEQQRQQQAAQQPPQPDPNMALVQVEQMKAQSEAALKQMQFELDQWKAQMAEDRERDKIARDTALREKEMELKYQTNIHTAELDAQVARERHQMDADVKREAVHAASLPRTVNVGRA